MNTLCKYSTNFVVKQLTPKVLDKDTFGIIKNYIKDSENADNEEYLNMVTTKKYNRVISELDGFCYDVMEFEIFFAEGGFARDLIIFNESYTEQILRYIKEDKELSKIDTYMDLH